jgi:hypothetical protein
MAQHVLSLEAPDTMNPCILRVVDTSVYNQDTSVECPILEITLPGFSYPVQFGEDKILPGFIENLTACDLEVQTSGCGTTFNNLPDGIYILKWSVSPNDKVYAEYNHLRITKALIMYNEALCELDLGTCEPGSETEKKLDTLRKIRMYLDAAKAKVEVCHEPRKGLELYKYAVKLLNKFECKSCQNY